MTDSPDMPVTVARWHQVARARDVAALDDLVADGAVFRSPAVHTPQEGKAVTCHYLASAFDVLGPTLTYHRQWYADGSAVLEFTAEVAGLSVQGVDMISWDAEDWITDFTVMVRPFKGLVKLMELMAVRLQQ